MPYIEQSRRIPLDNGDRPATIGEYVYVLTNLMTDFMDLKGKSFLTCAMIIGGTVCGILEFYRRIVAPYEDQKRAINGDVFK